MTTSCMRIPMSRVAPAAATIVTGMFCNGAALASQGPGGGTGTAGHVTQVGDSDCGLRCGGAGRQRRTDRRGARALIRLRTDASPAASCSSCAG